MLQPKARSKPKEADVRSLSVAPVAYLLGGMRVRLCVRACDVIGTLPGRNSQHTTQTVAFVSNIKPGTFVFGPARITPGAASSNAR